MDYEGSALPNFQGCISGFVLNDAPLDNLSPRDRWRVLRHGQAASSCDAVVAARFPAAAPLGQNAIIAVVVAGVFFLILVVVVVVFLFRRRGVERRKSKTPTDEASKWKHVGSTLLPSETMSSALGISHTFSSDGGGSGLYVDGGALADDASFNIQYHINRQLDRAKRNQLTAPDLVSATTPTLGGPAGRGGGGGGGNAIVASGGMPYRPPSVDPYSEPMMPDRYMTAGNPNRPPYPQQQQQQQQHQQRQHQQQQQPPPPHQGSLSTLLSLNQHHRTSSPLGRDFDSESEYSAFRSPQGGAGGGGGEDSGRAQGTRGEEAD